MAYIDVQFIGYVLDTSPQTNPDGSQTYLGLSNPQLDIEARCELMLRAMQTARVIQNVVDATADYLATITMINAILGLVVSLLQTLTQIQEQTLVFVPKILAIFFAILLFLPIMGGLLGGFTNQIFERIAAF